MSDQNLQWNSLFLPGTATCNQIFSQSFVQYAGEKSRNDATHVRLFAILQMH